MKRPAALRAARRVVMIILCLAAALATASCSGPPAADNAGEAPAEKY